MSSIRLKPNTTTTIALAITIAIIVAILITKKGIPLPNRKTLKQLGIIK